MKKYTVRQPTPEENQNFHDELPIAVFEDDKPVRFCASQAEAEEVAKQADDYQAVEEKMKELVRAMADERDMAEYEVWQIIHEVSEGTPRDI